MNTTSKLNLQCFCDPLHDSYAIGRPWRSWGKVYATNGFYAVECDPDICDPATRPDGHVPNVRAILDGADWPEPFKKFPHIEGPPHPLEANGLIIVDGSGFSQHMLWHVSQLPDVDYSMSESGAVCKLDKYYKPPMIVFRFTGGRGLLLPVAGRDWRL